MNAKGCVLSEKVRGESQDIEGEVCIGKKMSDLLKIVHDIL